MHYRSIQIMSYKNSDSEYFEYFNKLFQLWENSLSNSIFKYSDYDLLKNSSENISDQKSKFNNYITEVMNKSLTHCSASAGCKKEKIERKSNYLHHNYKTSSSNKPYRKK